MHNMGHKAEDQTQRKFVFMMKRRDFGSSSEIIVFWGDFSGHMGDMCGEF